jgi:hypothetical protein
MIEYFPFGDQYYSSSSQTWLKRIWSPHNGEGMAFISSFAADWSPQGENEQACELHLAIMGD